MNKNMHLKLETANQDGVTNWPLWSFLPIPFASFRFHHTRTGIAEKIYVAAWRLPILFPLEAIGSSDFFNGSPQLSTWATYIPGTPPRMPSDGLASIEWGWDLGPSNWEDLYPLSFFLGKWGGHTLPKTIGVPNCPLHVGHRSGGQLGWLAEQVSMAKLYRKHWSLSLLGFPMMVPLIIQVYRKPLQFDGNKSLLPTLEDQGIAPSPHLPQFLNRLK